MVPWVTWPIFTRALCATDCALQLGALPVANGSMPYWHMQGRPLEANPSTTLAILAVHGYSRNGQWQTCVMHRSILQTFEAKLVDERVLLLGLQVDEHKTEGRPEDSLYWEGSEWKTGEDGLFDVMDTFFSTLADQDAFPSLSNIIIVGHSAGAQLVQRFAVAGPSAEDRLEKRGVHLRYVASAPSSFLYLGPARPQGAPEPLDSHLCKPRNASNESTGIEFVIPDERASRECPLFDDWPFGLAGGEVPDFMIAASHGDPLHLYSKFSKRDFVVIAGDADVCNTALAALALRFQRTAPGCSDKHLDTRCGAMLQGACRLSRARAWVAAHRAKFGATVATQAVTTSTFTPTEGPRRSLEVSPQ